MTVKQLLQLMQEKRVANNKISPNAVEEFLKQQLEVNPYLPFLTKKNIVETIVSQNIEEVNGIKKVDNISQYIAFVVAMLVAHTNLEITEPFEDYDALCESKLLMLIIDLFREDYEECNTLLKMALASELEDNNLNSVVARFLDEILNKFDNVGDFIKNIAGDINLEDIIGKNFKQEDLIALSDFLNKQNK